MKLGYKLGAIASSLALVAGLGMALAAPAMADDDINMCLYLPNVGNPPAPGIECAFTAAANGDDIEMNSLTNGGSPFNAPDSGTHQISLYNSQSDPGGPYCMKLDLANDLIVDDQCQGLETEEWTTTATTEEIGTKTVTVYEYANEYYNNLCLNAPTNGKLDAVPCSGNRNQLWYETDIN
jgi:hypothetical protein